MILKTFALGVLVCILAGSPLPLVAQETQLDISPYARRADDNRMEFTVVHLNDLTTDLLFEAPAKYSMRAQARGATMFYISGTAKQDTEIVPFELQVGDRLLPLRMVNITNFESGVEVAEGDAFSGILTADELVNLRTPFVLRTDEWRWEYAYTPNEISQLEGGQP